MILGTPLMDGTILITDGAGASAGAGAGVIHITDGATTTPTATTLTMDTIMDIAAIMAIMPTEQEVVMPIAEDEAVTHTAMETEEDTLLNTTRQAPDPVEEETTLLHQAQEAVANITIQVQA